jgi:hypothetical protein
VLTGGSRTAEKNVEEGEAEMRTLWRLPGVVLVRVLAAPARTEFP